MKALRTIVLAAGKGTRMKSDIPKVLHPVCGKPIIRYVIDLVNQVGSLKTYVVLGHKSEQVAEYLGEDYTVVKQLKLLGTADAVRCAQKALGSYRGDILIVCGDTPLLSKGAVKNLIRRHKKTEAACTILTTVVHDPSGYGRIIRAENGKVVAIREDKDAVGLERDIAEINVGVYCFNGKELFAGLKEIKLNPKKKEFYLTDMIDLFTQKELKVETWETENPDECLGVNNRQDLATAQDYIRRSVLKDLMLQGVTIVDPATTYVDASAKIGKDTVIRPYSFIESDVRIGNRCVIGPFAHVRPGSRIGNDVEVGNFTEVNRSKLGDRTLMKHFSYLGDATLGSGVNIGAGTVTANYDGVNKHPTRIDNGAFIGSDSVFVAPVRIGKRAKIGAGSVVTRGKNIPDGAVAFGVPAQLTTGRKQK
jgi:bifunctional UDP-N-acetylglucosamine pyrophosphorylase/glucosamine-1-phosphate N-acetyltransferase